MTSRLRHWLASATGRYAAAGSLFGLAFPVVATLIEAAATGRGLGPRALLAAQAATPLLWIIDTAPVFLGAFAAVGGIRQDRVHALNGELEARVAERTAALVATNASLSEAREQAE